MSENSENACCSDNAQYSVQSHQKHKEKEKLVIIKNIYQTLLLLINVVT